LVVTTAILGIGDSGEAVIIYAIKVGAASGFPHICTNDNMMIIKKSLLFTVAFFWLLGGCDPGATDRTESGGGTASPPAASVEPTRFNGVWEVTGRTGNEDGTNKPVCGFETGLGTVTIEGSRITGNITNKSGFDYTVEGTIDNTGTIKAMLIYSGYDAAELFGTFVAETNSAKGSWKDAVNACPGVWQAIRITDAVTVAPAESDEGQDKASRAGKQAAKVVDG
jgi:hypothetical protein